MNTFRVIWRRPTKLCLSHRHFATEINHPDSAQTSAPHVDGPKQSLPTHSGPSRSKKLMEETACRRYGQTFALGAAMAVILPGQWCAATGELPWNQALVVLQAILIGPVAHAAIALAFIGAGFLYAVGGYDKQAGRLAASGIGSCLALGAIRLLNFVFP